MFRASLLLLCAGFIIGVESWTSNYQVVTRYRWRYRYILTYYRCGCYYLCGWCRPRTCCRWVRQAYQESYLVRICQNGWTGCYCHIPICNPPCVRGQGVCVAPNICRCNSVAWTGPTCATQVCSYLTNCYPGRCFTTSGVSGPQCECVEGYSGQNCGQLDTGPNITSCEAHLERWYQNKLVAELTVPCNMDDITTSDQATEVYVGERDFTHIRLTWSAEYIPEVEDLPLRPNYVTDFTAAISSAGSNLTLHKLDGPSSDQFLSNCENKAQPNNPQHKVDCSVSYGIENIAVREGFKYVASFEAETGGRKRIRNDDTGSQQYYPITGTSFSKEVHVLFDTEPPFHCLKYDNCPADYPDTPVAFAVDQDIANRSVTFIILGWNDSYSGVDRFEYKSMKMAVDFHGNLFDFSESLSSQVWRYGDGDGVPTYEPDEPGMYNIELWVRDVANNTAKARTLLLYDPDSEVTTNPERPMFVPTASPESDYKWMTARGMTGNIPVVLNWTEHFENKFLHDNQLLNPVRPAPSGVIEDTEGFRTTSAIDNVRGIVNFTVQYKKERNLNNLEVPPVTEYQVPDIHDQVFDTTFTTVNDGETVKFWVTSQDVSGRVLTDTTMVHIDSSPPTVANTSNPTHQVNASFENPEVPYATRVTVNAVDTHSGIREIRFTLYDQSDGDVTVYSGVAPGRKVPQMTDDQCAGDAKCDYCISMGDCFSNTNLVYVDHCQILDNQGHSFWLRLTVLNQAGNPTQVDYQMGILSDLAGIGLYPSVQNAKITNITDNMATFSWELQPACYLRENILIRYSWRGLTFSKQIEGSLTSYTVTDLISGTNITFSIVVVYNGERESNPVVVAEKTKGNAPPIPAEPLGAAVIVGIVLGVLLLIMVVAVIVLMVLRKRSGKPPIPPAVKEFPRRMTQRFRQNQYVEKGSTVSTGVHINNTLDRRLKEVNNPTYSKDFDDEVDDEIYMYGDMQYGRSDLEISRDQVTFGDIITSGKFADVIVATVRERNGPRVTVAAKMLKEPSKDGDHLLMKAKKNFMLQKVTRNDYLVNLYGVVEPGPILLLEYCEAGSLKDWVVNLGSPTPEDLNFMKILCLHVTKGMAHLHSQNVLHRRLAARNVLLTDIAGELHAKVHGFGPLPGDRFEREFMKDNKKKEGRIPVKWMAPESLKEPQGSSKGRVYSQATDVWTFGVVMWEVFSLGDTPYDVKTRHELHELLNNGHRLAQPQFASDVLYDVMMTCWEAKPEYRPSMATLTRNMDEMIYGSQTDDEYYGRE